MKRHLPSAFFAFIAICSGITSVQAATLYIGPSETLTTIQSAIDAASDGDVIIVRDGTYSGPGNRDIDFRGKAVHLKSENGPAACSIIAGGTDVEPHQGVLLRSGEGNGSILEGFTITGGVAPGPSSTGGAICILNASPTIINNDIRDNTASQGAAVYNYGGSPIMRGNTFSGNQASTYGGAVYSLSGSPTISGNTFIGNRALRGGAIAISRGGGMISDNTISSNTAETAGGIFLQQSFLIKWVTVSNNTILDNTATHGSARSGGGGISVEREMVQIISNAIVDNTIGGDARGGGIFVYCDDTIITGNLIKGNFADGDSGNMGGGIYLRGRGVFSRNTILGNTAGCGGGLSVPDYPYTTFLDNVVASNLALLDGGGIYGPFTSSRNVIFGNVALRNGGGAFNTNMSYGDVVAGNRAGQFGGGICSPNFYASESGSTFFGNSSAAAGALYSTSCTRTIANCIFWENTSADGHQIVYENGSTQGSIQFCDIEGGIGSVSVLSGDMPRWGQGNIDADPLFASPGYWDDSGTPDDPDDDSWIAGDYHLKSQSGRWDPGAPEGGAWVLDTVTSPCIDTGALWADFSQEPAPNGGRVNMGAYGNTVEASKTFRTYVLTVKSSPPGVPIEGDLPGVTDYAAVLLDGAVVNLSAPASATIDMAHYTFSYWRVDSGSRDFGQTNVQITMDKAHTATAVYKVQMHVLFVYSSPITGVEIEGSHSGTTNYSFYLADQTKISLSAAPLAVSGGWRYTFLRWMLDGKPLPDGQLEIAFVMDAFRNPIAVYEKILPVLILRGPADRGEPPLPPGGGSFTVDLHISYCYGIAAIQAALDFLDQSGTSAGFLIRPDQSNLNFSLSIEYNAACWPVIFPLRIGDRRLFGFLSLLPDIDITEETWLFTVTYDYGPAACGRYSIMPDPVITMIAGSTGSLDFQTLAGSLIIGEQRTLTIDSTPISHIAIGGDTPGVTPYTAACADGEEIALSAPERVTLAGTEYRFLRWIVDGADQPAGQREITLTMSADRAATSVWALSGDIDGNCVVDLADLIAVRDRLLVDPGSPGYLDADLNGDGRVNVLDLILVRNLMGTRCPQ
ncbi:MAG TPA: dockerin type I domain-containing protein [Planctomycetota bacterium]|nr:dockerin type I domain-containing protein [Planctomycetota bacterium]